MVQDNLQDKVITLDKINTDSIGTDGDEFNDSALKNDSLLISQEKDKMLA